jgi:hypothetical protein
MKPSMLRQEMKSPTAVPAALIKTTVANKTAAKEAAHQEHTATMGESRIDALPLIPVCTENLSSGVVVMKSAQDGK